MASVLHPGELTVPAIKLVWTEVGDVSRAGCVSRALVDIGPAVLCQK